MTGIITGNKEDNRRVSFVVVLGDADGGLLEMSHGDFFGAVRKANLMYSDISDFNGKKCRVNLDADNRLIRFAGL